jgi:hypothetical protein
MLPWSVPVKTLAWLTLLGGSLAIGVPVPTGSILNRLGVDPTMSPPGLDAILACALATCGGLLLSIALASRQLRR